MTQPYESPWFDDEPAQPIHKRPWFVVVGGLAAVGVLGALIGGTSTDEPPAAAPSASPTSDSRPPARSSASTVPVAPSSTGVPTPTPTPTPTETAAGPTAVSFVMPDVVGTDLQSAQNLIQTHGVFFTVSHDLLGNRNQALDSNWLVCDQNIPPGQQVTGDVEGQIDFGVVKRGEACP